MRATVVWNFKCSPQHFLHFSFSVQIFLCVLDVLKSQTKNKCALLIMILYQWQLS